MGRVRKASDEGNLIDFLREFLIEQFGEIEKAPQWVKDALDYAGYNVVKFVENKC
jgi:hypothetical protein